MEIYNNKEIIMAFVEEAKDVINNLSIQLIDYEKSPNSKDLYDALYRGFHTIKGTASFLQLDAMVTIAHLAEQILEKTKTQAPGTSMAIDTLLSAIDGIDAMVGQLNETYDAKKLTNPAFQLIIDQLREFSNSDLKNPVNQSSEIHSKIDAPHSSNIEKEKSTEPSKSLEKNSDKNISNDEIDRLFKSKNTSTQENRAVPSQKKKVTTQKNSQRVQTEKPTAKVKPLSKPKFERSQGHKKNEVQDNIRLNTQQADELLNLIGELVLIRNGLLKLNGDSLKRHENVLIKSLDHLTDDLQESVMKIRMQPINFLFQRFPRVIRDTASKLNKLIQLDISGETTELDKKIIESITDPLTHLIRNAVDHGIETPVEREAKGKSKYGSIKIQAIQKKGAIHITIQDDGKGVDIEAIKQKAFEFGRYSQYELDNLTHTQLCEMIFHPGFSTKTNVSSISGRGVGLDVVKSKITAINGSVTVKSKKDIGCIFDIRIPITLAMMPSLLVRCCEQIYAIPVANINKVIMLQASEIQTMTAQKAIIYQDEPIPFYQLNKFLEYEKLQNDQGDSVKNSKHVAIITQVKNKLIAVHVDHVVTEEEVVIKPLGKLLKNIKGYVGATITSEGETAMILDIPTLIDQKMQKVS